MELVYYNERRNLFYARNKLLHYGRNYTDVFHFMTLKGSNICRKIIAMGT